MTPRTSVLGVFILRIAINNFGYGSSDFARLVSSELLADPLCHSIWELFMRSLLFRIEDSLDEG